MGIMPGLKAFVAAVLGGIGNVPGAASGASSSAWSRPLVGGTAILELRDAIAFAILILILLFRPAGCSGALQAEKV